MPQLRVVSAGPGRYNIESSPPYSNEWVVVDSITVGSNGIQSSSFGSFNDVASYQGRLQEAFGGGALSGIPIALGPTEAQQFGIPVNPDSQVSAISGYQGATDADPTTGSALGGLSGADYGLTFGGNFSDPYNLGVYTPDGRFGLSFNTKGDYLDWNLSGGLGDDFDFTAGSGGYNIGTNTGFGAVDLTGNTNTGTVNVGGSVNTPVGPVSGDTNVPDTLDDFDASTGLGDALEGAGDFIYTLFTNPTELFSGLSEGGFDLDNLGLSADGLMSEIGEFFQNPGNAMGQFGDYLTTEGQQLYNNLFGGSSSGGSTPNIDSTGGTGVGGSGGGIDPLWSLLGGVLGLLGDGQNKVTQNTNTRDVGTPLLTGTDPMSMQFQGALGNQLNAPDIANNPYFQPALNAAFAPVMDNFMTQVLPAIRGQAVTTNNVGSSRHGIAEGAATRDLTRNLANAGAQAAYQFNQSGMQNQANALQTLMNARGGTGTNVTRNTTTELDPVTQFLSGLTGSLGLIGEYNKIAGGG